MYGVFTGCMSTFNIYHGNVWNIWNKTNIYCGQWYIGSRLTWSRSEFVRRNQNGSTIFVYIFFMIFVGEPLDPLPLQDGFYMHVSWMQIETSCWEFPGGCYLGEIRRKVQNWGCSLKFGFSAFCSQVCWTCSILEGLWDPQLQPPKIISSSFISVFNTGRINTFW